MKLQTAEYADYVLKANCFLKCYAFRIHSPELGLNAFCHSI
jgi:hypothetical protein